MMSKPVSGDDGIFFPTSKATSEEHSMLFSKTGGRVVLKVTLNFETRKGMKWRPCVFPCIANYTIDISLLKVVNRTRREPSHPIKISIQILIFTYIQYVLISHCKKLLLSRKLIFPVSFFVFC